MTTRAGRSLACDRIVWHRRPQFECRESTAPGHVPRDSESLALRVTVTVPGRPRRLAGRVRLGMALGCQPSDSLGLHASLVTH